MVALNQVGAPDRWGPKPLITPRFGKTGSAGHFRLWRVKGMMRFAFDKQRKGRGPRPSFVELTRPLQFGQFSISRSAKAFISVRLRCSCSLSVLVLFFPHVFAESVSDFVLASLIFFLNLFIHLCLSLPDVCSLCPAFFALLQDHGARGPRAHRTRGPRDR